MKMIYIKRSLLVLSISFSLVLSSCSSDSDSDKHQDNPSENSYSITIAGDKTYSNSFPMDSEEGMVISPHNQNPEGDQNIALIVDDELKNFSLQAALFLNTQTMQPLSLGNLATSEGEHSNMIITVGELNYMSNSGSVTLSNLKIKPLTSFTGFASFKLVLDGTFDRMDTPEIEQIQITGEVVSANQF